MLDSGKCAFAEWSDYRLTSRCRVRCAREPPVENIMQTNESVVLNANFDCAARYRDLISLSKYLSLARRRRFSSHD